MTKVTLSDLTMLVNHLPSGYLIPVDLSAIPAKTVYKRGQRYRHPDGSDYVLVQVSSGSFCLVSLDDFNRYIDPVIVQNINNITHAEFWRMCGSRAGEFKLIP